MKRRTFLSISFLAVLALSAIPCSAREWRNFVPLHTTRAEILHVLGNPKYNPDKSEYFDLNSETVTFKWVNPNCPTESPVPDGQPVQPNDLALTITVTPKGPVRLENDSKPKTYSDWLLEDIDCIGNGLDGVENCTIWNQRDGFGYATSKGNVVRLFYFPSDAEAKAWNSAHRSCSP